MNPYDILGIARTSTKEQARAAYRKLAMKHHPDRVPLNEQLTAEAKFKEVKAAWELIDNGWTAPSVILKPVPQGQHPSKRTWSKPEVPTGTWRGDTTNEEMVKPRAPAPTYTRPQPPKPPPYKPPQSKRIIEAYQAPILSKVTSRKVFGEFIARISIQEAFNGFIVEVKVNDEIRQIAIPPGAPHDLIKAYPIDDGDVIINIRFNQSSFIFRGATTALTENTIVNGEIMPVIRTGHLETTAQLMSRATPNFVMIDNFLGEQIRVNIPPWHDVRKSVRVEGQGYFDWFPSQNRCSGKRGDLWVWLLPFDEYVKSSSI